MKLLSINGAVAAVFLSLVLPALAGEQPQNLVANGDFSAAGTKGPADWTTSGDAKFVTQSLTVQRDEQNHPFARLACTRCEGQGGAIHAMLAQVGKVHLIRGKTYEFTVRLRQQGISSRSITIGISNTKTWTNAGLLTQIPVTGQWKTHRRVFQSNQDVGPESRLQIWYGETGTLDVADVRLVEWDAGQIEFTDVVAPGTQKNLIANGSFELGAAGWSTWGTGTGWGDVCSLHGQIVQGNASHGGSFLRIPLGGASTPVLYFDYLKPIVRREIRPLAANLGWIKVDPGQSYTLSCMMRASKEGVPALVGVHAADPGGRRRDHKQSVTLSTAWQRYSITFKPQQRYVFVFAGPDLKEEQTLHVDVDAMQLEKSAAATAFITRDEVEFAMAPAEEAGIFTQNQQPALLLRLANSSSSPIKASVRFAVADYRENALDLAPQALDVASHATSEVRLPLPANWRGFYRITATARIADQERQAVCRVAIVPPRHDNDSVLGINHAFADGKMIRLASKGGVTWYRDWSLKWEDLEPHKGQFNWGVGDQQIDRVLREKVKLMALMPPFPSANWSSEASDKLVTTGYPGIRLRQAWGPKDPAELGQFVEKTVDHFKDRMKVWEFLNEPVYTSYALPEDKANQYPGKHYTAADYARLLEVAAAAMRKADPSCKVMGGIAGHPNTLTREVIEAGCLKNVDLFNLHIYPGITPPEKYLPQMDKLLALMDAHGGRKPIWMTEFSYYGCDDFPRTPFVPSASNWAEARMLEDERQCADFTLRFILVMLSRNVEKIFIHSGASGAVNQPNFECCLFGQDGVPRKVFAALAVLTDLLGPTPKYIGEASPASAVHCVAFETGRSALLAIWGEDVVALKAATLPQGQGLSWLDVCGRTLSEPPGAADLSPVYLVGSAGRARELLKRLQP